MAYITIEADESKYPLDLLIDWLNEHDLNDGDSPVYLHFNQDGDYFVASWPEPVPQHLRSKE